MKAIICLLAGAFLLTGFRAIDNSEKLDGIWLGYYKSEKVKEKILIKFGTEDRMEFYAGGVDEDAKCNGSYRLLGDSVSFTYTNAMGEEISMKGTISRKLNYVDGIWKSKDGKGAFFIERQDIEEMVVQP